VVGVVIQIVRYADEAQPGWVECQLIDVNHRVWSFIEKVPVVSAEALDAFSVYPRPGVIACEVTERTLGKARIDTARPWGVESVEGETRFEVPTTALIEL
jgi:hypothetical protein